MKYTRLFNNHGEYVAYSASTDFEIPNVSWCIQEEEAHCTPRHVQCIEGHTYALYGEPEYPSTVAGSATSFQITFGYSDTYTAYTCNVSVTYGEDSDYVTITPNPTTSARTISGTYYNSYYGISIPYSLTQEASEELPYSQRYLTFDIISGGTLAWTAKSGVTKTISYSINDGEWTTITSTAAPGTIINVNAGDKVRVKGTNSTYGTAKDTCSSFSTGSTAYYNVEGNIMSLIGGDDFTGLTSFNGATYVFHSLFDGSKVVSAENLVLPVMTLTDYCYRAMFANCMQLEVAPQLPATTLAEGCYWYMFSYCSSLTTSPVLPAETLVKGCYQGMFRNCAALNHITCMATSISASGATSAWVSNVAETGTFVESENTSWPSGINGIPINWRIVNGIEEPLITCDGVDVIITNSTEGASIYYKLDNTGDFVLYNAPIPITADTFVEAYAVFDVFTSNTVSETCIYAPTHHYENDYLTFRIRTNGKVYWHSNGSGQAKTIEYSLNDGAWTSLAATDASSYIDVSTNDIVRFRGTNTSYAGSKANYSGFGYGERGISAAEGYDTDAAEFDIEGNIMSLVYGDNFTGNTAMTGTYNFCSIFKKAKCVSAENLVLPSTTLTQYCYRAMFSWCTKLTTPPALPATTLAQGCYWYMFEHCSITTAPELLATTLVYECYGWMFTNCNNLNYIKCLATTGFTTNNCLAGWTNNVASTGTFVKDGNTAITSGKWTRGVNGIPTNWIVVDDGTPDVPTIVCDGFEIELSCATDGASIYYQLDHSGSYSVYSTAITMTGDTFIECYSEKEGHSSTTTSMTCEYDDRTIYEYANQSLDTWTRSGSSVTLPNSVNAIDGHSANYSKGTFNYETSVQLRDAEPTYLWFQHADQSATIYVDNTEVEKHWGGYGAFFTDISSYTHKGVNNIKVALKNNEGNVLAPYTGDFNFNATLGKVKLFTSPYLPAMDYGYDGFHITSTVSTASATINVKTNIPVGASVVCTISGTNCNYTATSASTGDEMIFTTTISNPRLWNGTIDPYLYNVKLEIYHDNELYHRYERPYGLRFYEYVINQTVNGNSYTGFLLNGQPYLLRGCCMHDDIAGKANALNDADYTQQFNLITDLGLNFLRLAHYPHPKEVYDWCDRLGIIVETEVPCVNNLQSTMPPDYYSHLSGQYADMVNQHYNHPCIMFWGLSNEAKVTEGSEGANFAKDKIEGYTTLIKELDSERMVGLVAHALTNPLSYFGNPTNIDWIGSNLYEGWYQNQTSNNPTSRLNTCISNTISSSGVAFAFSEYGCGGTQRCHSESASTTTNKGSGGARHDIEYMMWLHEGHIAAIKNKPELLFSAQWVLFDFAVANRNEGYTVCLDGVNTSIDEELRRLNDKGLVERDHVTKKDPFYLYKAWWNTADTFVHICGKNYTKSDSRVIKCYTNETGSLTMYINGTSAETVSITNNIATFTARNFYDNNTIIVSGATASDTFTLSGGTDPSLDYVEIAGTKWAKMNVGANTPTDYGLYFQWGDVSGYTAAQVGQKIFGWADYKYGNGTASPGETGMTKYNSTDGKTVLDITDDAAYANLGSDWRMPTIEEFQALGNAVNTAYTENYQGTGVSGLVCTDKTNASNELFFPELGYADNSTIYGRGITYYWSSSLSNTNKTYACRIYSSNDSPAQWKLTCTRRIGLPIRPVKIYDSEIEYLSGDGHQYIDTNIVPDSSTGIKVTLNPDITNYDGANDVYIVGLRDDSNDTRWCLGKAGDAIWAKAGVYYGYGTYTYFGKDEYDNDRYYPYGTTFTLSLNFLNSKYAVNGERDSISLPSTMPFTATNVIRIFGSSGVSGGYTKYAGKIYSVQISQGNQIVMDLIPVRVGNVGYMFDKISGNLYGNNGTGSFTLGPDAN